MFPITKIDYFRYLLRGRDLGLGGAQDAHVLLCTLRFLRSGIARYSFEGGLMFAESLCYFFGIILLLLLRFFV